MNIRDAFETPDMVVSCSRTSTTQSILRIAQIVAKKKSIPRCFTHHDADAEHKGVGQRILVVVLQKMNTSRKDICHMCGQGEHCCENTMYLGRNHPFRCQHQENTTSLTTKSLPSQKKHNTNTTNTNTNTTTPRTC